MEKRKRRKRRFNGTGSVWKLQGRRAKPWIARVQNGMDSEGKPNYIYTYHETAADAERAIPGMQKQAKNNPKAEYTVSQVWESFKATRWDKITDNTRTMYEQSYENWKALHNRQMRDLKTSDMQDIINQRKDKSYSLLTKMRALMVALFNEAAKDDIVTKNYASLIEVPKGKPESKRRAFTDTELEAIRKVSGQIPYADVVLFMCYTGLRPTEMCLLTAKDIDTNAWTITGGIKTEAGRNRVVPIHASIRPIVTAWLNKGGDRVFMNEHGKPLDKNSWEVRFKNVMKALFGKDHKIVPYTTRHTCASMLHAAGADYLNIAKIMGHADYTTTANIYTHVDLDELRKAVETLE